MYCKVTWYERMKSSGIFAHNVICPYTPAASTLSSMYTYLVQLSNYQIQMLIEKKDKRAATQTPSYSIKFTIDWPSSPHFDQKKMQKVSSFPVSALQYNYC